MNGTQIQTTLAPIIAFIAGILAAKFTFFDGATWTSIVTAVVGLAAAIWGGFAARKNGLVTTVANMPEVDTINLNKSAPTSKTLEAATPDNVTIKS